MSNKLKDSKLGEKDEYVVEGVILADEFRDRKTGRKIDVLPSEVITEEELAEALADKVSSLTVLNITALTDAQLNGLKCGDVVLKEDSTGKHAYKVTYKQEHHGICLSYFDCGYLETISYDYTDGHWVFNSKDVCEVQEKITSSTDLVAKTLKQTEANWSVDLDLQPYDASKTSISKAYGKICVVNGIMYIVISCTNTNITESSQSVQSYAPMEITIPESIGSKIFDEDGNDLTTAGTNKIISSAYVRQGAATSFAWIYHQGANKLKISNAYNGATVNAGASLQSELRTFLVLF